MTIKSRVHNTVAPVSGCQLSEFTDDSRLTDDLCLDSRDVVDPALELEDDFDVEVKVHFDFDAAGNKLWHAGPSLEEARHPIEEQGTADQHPKPVADTAAPQVDVPEYQRPPTKSQARFALTNDNTLLMWLDGNLNRTPIELNKEDTDVVRGLLTGNCVL